MYNTLKIGIYGMIEGKRETHPKKQNDDDDYFEEPESHRDSTMPTSSRIGHQQTYNSDGAT